MTFLPASPALAADHTAVQRLPIELGASGSNAFDESRRFCCGGTQEPAIVVYVDQASPAPPPLPERLEGIRVRIIGTARFVAR